MKRTNLLSLLLVCIVILGAKSVVASTVVVGKCRTGLPTYSTIQEAVNAATTGSTVEVCAGSYPEQVIISTPLTLVGIANGKQGGRATVTFPAAGLATTVNSVTGGGILAPQVLVKTGPVNITNITVDGSGNNLNGLSETFVGVLYQTLASGTINGVTAREQNNCGGCGVGIWAETGIGTSESVTIENSEVHDADNLGIWLASAVFPSTLTVTVKGNQINNTPSGILCGWLAGTVSGNVITNYTNRGIVIAGPQASITGNTVATLQGGSGTTGIFVSGGGPENVKSNTIIGTNTGIDLTSASGATVESNRIILTPGAGIEFGCTSGNTVSGNTINDAVIGLDKVPTGFVVPGTLLSVNLTRTGGC